MKFAFRVDSSYQIGSGHLMRCLTLAKALKDKKIESIFISIKNKDDMSFLLKKHNFKILNINNKKIDKKNFFSWKTDAEDTLKKIKDEKITHLIADHYEIDENWEKYLYKHLKKIIVIDDLANRKHFCDILLDYSLPVKDYSKLVPLRTEILSGPKFALLDKSFLKERKKTKQEKKISKNKNLTFYVSFGASDFTQETKKTLIALKKFGNNLCFKANIIVGKNNKQKKDIKKFCSKEDNFYYYEQPEKVAPIMSKSNFGIGSPGTTTWERSCMGLPSILISVADNQIEIGKACNKLKIANYIGDSKNISSDDLKDLISKMSKNPKKMFEYKEAGLKLVDGLGASRVLRKII